MRKILACMLFSCIFLPVWADVSPLPEIQFSFIYNTENKPLISSSGSELIQCKDRLCQDSAPLGVYGAQKLACGPGTCEAVAYDFEPFAKLVITFEDGSTRTSNIFALRDRFITYLNVYVDADRLTVEPVENAPHEALYKRPQAWGALVLILGLELLTAAAFVLYTKKRFTILYGVALANVLTTAFTWGVLVHYVAQSAWLWLCCVILEAGLVALINRKDISLKEAGMLSIMMNVTSYTLGMILSFMWVAL